MRNKENMDLEQYKRRPPPPIIPIDADDRKPTRLGCYFLWYDNPNMHTFCKIYTKKECEEIFDKSTTYGTPTHWALVRDDGEDLWDS